MKKIFSHEVEFIPGFVSASKDNPNEKIQLANVSQFVKFKIDEDGCESGNVGFSGLLNDDLPMAPEMDFIVNRPFIVIVREKSTPCPLLIGKIYNL